MTWVIGAPTSFGYAMGLSDIQVTWGTAGPFHDCLRKVYEVAPFIVAGFAGSVRLGFSMLEDLARFLSPSPEPGESWIPRWVALNWYRRARRIYTSAPEDERKLGSSIMLMGVRPRDNSGCITGGHSDVIILSHMRAFQPRLIGIGDVESIGSGNGVEFYMNELQALQANPLPRMQGEIGRRGGMGEVWGSSLARFLRANPVPGISQNVHHILVWRDRVQIRPLNLTRISADGTRIEYPMPPVANGWAQFARFAERAGLRAAEAQA